MGGGMSIEMWRAEDENVGVNSGLQDKVFEELRSENALDHADLYVDVEDRVVTLSGTIGSYAEKLAAGAAAWRVRGVRDVRNEITVVSNGDLAHAA